MPIDLSKIREQAAGLNKPPPSDDGGDGRRQLQQARGALNADALPPGREPVSDPVDDAIHAGRAAGGRGSDTAVAAYFEKILEGAEKGDPRVVSQGVVTSETREQWMADAHQRQVANRDNSGMTHR